VDNPLNSATALAYCASAIIAGGVTFLSMPILIRTCRAHGMTGADQNKFGKPLVAEMGGAAVVIGFFSAVVSLMIFDYFTPGQLIPNVTLFLAALLAALGAAFVGAIDDLFDLRQRMKAVLPILFAIPLGLYYTDTAVHLPRGVEIQLGVLMVPVIAFMVSAGANASNMLEGFNGLGAGLGLIMAGSMAALAVYAGRGEALLVLAPFLGATAAFFWFNRFPAKVFPGDTYTLFMGATLVSAAVLVDLKEAAAILFIPMIIEFVLKARNKFSDQTYGTPQPNGEITYSGRTGSITHIFMKVGVRSEKGVVRSVWALEGVIAAVFLALILI
jgi:UDP-N-acetylglucosamine--dolichyl-phosphate N-acetylglucosaminephosphotransferase